MTCTVDVTDVETLGTLQETALKKKETNVMHVKALDIYLETAPKHQLVLTRKSVIIAQRLAIMQGTALRRLLIIAEIIVILNAIAAIKLDILLVIAKVIHSKNATSVVRKDILPGLVQMKMHDVKYPLHHSHHNTSF